MAGYQTLWEKVGILVSANLNGLMDRALSLNSVAVFDEYLNRMRAELAALQSAEGFERGRVRTLTRQLAGLERECSQYDQDVDRLLLRGGRELAAGLQTMLNTKRGLIEQLSQSLDEARSEITRLTGARTSLGVQIDATEAKRSELQALLQQKRAADLRARATTGFTGQVGASAQAQAVIERVRQETDVAIGRAEVAGATLDARIDEIIGAETVDQQLRERESRLKGDGAGEEDGSETGT